MKPIKLGNWGVFWQFHNPFSKEGKGWELLFIFRCSKQFNVVAKGKGTVTTYFFSIAFFNFAFQKIERRLYLC
jgi:hypothetical protein